MKLQKRKDGRLATTITVFDPRTGENVKKYIYGRTKKELLEKLEKAKKSTCDSDTPMRKIILEWYSTALASSTDNTKRMYDTTIAKLDPIANVPVSQVTAPMLNEILRKIADKPNQAQKVYMTMNRIFEMAVFMGYIDKNPCTFLAKPKYHAPEKRVATDEEIKAVDMTVFTPREDLFFRLIRNYGLRKGEALAVTKESFDFKNNKLIVNASIDFSSNRGKSKAPKTASGNRKIPLLSKDILFFKKMVRDSATDYLFTNATNENPISATSFKRMWAGIVKKVEKTAKDNNLTLPGTMTCHIWRHTYCTDLLLADVPPKTVQYLMGHSSITVTMDIYTHINENRIDRSKFEKMRELNHEE